MNENIEFKKIAFLVNDEVFYVMHIPATQEFGGVFEGMMSSPTVIDVSENDMFVEKGTRLIEGEFYIPRSRFIANEIDEPDYEVE
jgi:hypothetical protein